MDALGLSMLGMQVAGSQYPRQLLRTPPQLPRIDSSESQNDSFAPGSARRIVAKRDDFEVTPGGQFGNPLRTDSALQPAHGLEPGFDG